MDWCIALQIQIVWTQERKLALQRFTWMRKLIVFYKNINIIICAICIHRSIHQYVSVPSTWSVCGSCPCFTSLFSLSRSLRDPCARVNILKAIWRSIRVEHLLKKNQTHFKSYSTKYTVGHSLSTQLQITLMVFLIIILLFTLFNYITTLEGKKI